MKRAVQRALRTVEARRIDVGEEKTERERVGERQFAEFARCYLSV
jgi:hypothetical protein